MSICKRLSLNTTVISMFSPSKPTVPEGFIRWLEAADAEGTRFLSVLTVHGIEKGVALLERKGATARGASLRLWLSGLVSTYDDRILSIDTTVSTRSGQLGAIAVAAGHSPGMADALIAGTAKVHDLVVVTRNPKHFDPFGIGVMAPGADDPRNSGGSLEQ
ncbi:type II toxin-antitoxin system VapC family toxin [Sinorhizobium meliloti]|uniref:type II toxin-antitoxin system VapC family toxin n=1 Tax=Rhizobium meliloti TaxID=382 RepID=UPI001F45F34A|nr:type II toxin-antitoxin system VapC family toxin [Sinorhizobium meliloti]